jgi:anthraniloyl-CoA monooxygenase
LLKKAKPETDIEVYERSPKGVTWGWGVVFSKETMGNFLEADEGVYEAITREFAHWEDIDTYYKDRLIRSTGHDFAGLARVTLLNLLGARAEELDIPVHYDTEVEDFSQFDDCDVLIGADGLNSRVREANKEALGASVEQGRARFVWLGSDKSWDAFTFIVRENEHGVFQVHAYQFEEGTSTFIVECDEQSWKNAGFREGDEQQTIDYFEKLFAPELDGAKLLANHSHWRIFPTVRCEKWHVGNTVIIGDAAHTAHFSIGSGTKLAMEDAIALATSLTKHDDIPTALEDYYESHWLGVAKIQRAADVSRKWFEEISRYCKFEPEQFVASLMSRSKKITHDNLRIRDPKFVQELDAWFAKSQGLEVPEGQDAPPPMFVPYKLRELELANRVVVSPMCMYSAEDGTPNDFHLVHLGGRADGGAGLVIAEMTNVSAAGRISPGCTGLYKDEHIAAWKRITDYVHQGSSAKIGVQLGHAGRMGSTSRLFDGGEPLSAEEGAWETCAPSAIAFDAGWPTPVALDRAGMLAIVEEYKSATRRALAAGFDLVEVHMAHGYLLSTFISPLSNQRDDEYGGELEARMRFPLEVLDAVREIWPANLPVSVRISATDWKDGGTTPDDAVEIARMLQAHGCDLVDVSAGGIAHDAEPIYGRMFQTPFADRIRNEVGVSTMAVGNIQGWDHVNTIVASGRADLCALARPHLYDPCVVNHAAAEQGREELARWPQQYRAAGSVAARIAEARRQQVEEDTGE